MIKRSEEEILQYNGNTATLYHYHTDNNLHIGSAMRESGMKTFLLVCPKCLGSGTHWSPSCDYMCLRCRGGGFLPATKSRSEEDMTSFMLNKAVKVEAAEIKRKAQEEEDERKRKEHEEKMEVLKKQRAEDSKHYGEVGEKISVLATIVHRQMIETVWGVSYLILAVSQEGAKFKTFTSAAWASDGDNFTEDGSWRNTFGKGQKVL